MILTTSPEQTSTNIVITSFPTNLTNTENLKRRKPGRDHQIFHLIHVAPGKRSTEITQMFTSDCSFTWNMLAPTYSQLRSEKKIAHRKSQPWSWSPTWVAFPPTFWGELFISFQLLGQHLFYRVWHRKDLWRYSETPNVSRMPPEFDYHNGQRNELPLEGTPGSLTMDKLLNFILDVT